MMTPAQPRMDEAQVRTQSYPWKQCRIYRLTPLELALLVARGMGMGVLAPDGQSVMTGLPLGLAPVEDDEVDPVFDGASVVDVHRYPNGNYAVKIRRDGWPGTPQGEAHPLARDVPGGSGSGSEVT